MRRAGPVLARHEVEIDLAANLPAVRTDSVLFEQVLFNLFDNAAKYAAAGTKVRIAGVVAGNSVRLEVSDEGDGVPPADLERIFDKFYRVQAADRKRAGTGLGLPIARGFVESMGGTIAAQGRSDRTGTALTISFPVNARRADREIAA